MHEKVKLLIGDILKHPSDQSRKWSVQGLGMMRFYLSDSVRLHIWDSSLKVPGASALHTHPWDLDSVVVAGRYKQHRYTETPADSTVWDDHVKQQFKAVTIQCGEGACVMSEPEEVTLVEGMLETYLEGMGYHQDSNEIHWSIPEDGTVTLVTRTFKADRDHARVLWRGKGPWVDAKPRPATPLEIVNVTARALETWF